MKKISREVRELQLKSLHGKTFVGWVDGYKNIDSKAVMRCDIDGNEWCAKIDHLLNTGSGCPRCAGRYLYSSEERELQINSLSCVDFVRWVDEYVNKNSRAVVRCHNDHEWSASVNNLLNHSSRCPTCAGNSRKTARECESKLKQIECAHFVRWDGEYANNSSKAVMLCSKGHEWSARVYSLLGGSRCPVCARSGFDPKSQAKLYALRSECRGHIKIGITGDIKSRIAKLSRSTPFNFSTVSSIEGVGHEIRNLEKLFHSNFESSGFSGFDGATEWLKFDPAIIELMKMLGAEVPDELLSAPL